MSTTDSAEIMLKQVREEKRLVSLLIKQLDLVVKQSEHLNKKSEHSINQLEAQMVSIKKDVSKIRCVGNIYITSTIGFILIGICFLTLAYSQIDFADKFVRYIKEHAITCPVSPALPSSGDNVPKLDPPADADQNAESK